MDLQTLGQWIVSGAVAGLIAWGGMRADVSSLKKSNSRLHERVDALMLLLAEHGLVSGKKLAAAGRRAHREE
ncbi:MAG TPA: hypothetical protein VJ437_13060 [Acidiferrobacterales bacterium]|nr:hypothetical protein [Acidiferrobacterales bacterium]